MSFVLNQYSVLIRGFPPNIFDAKSPGQARARAFRAYQSYDNLCKFKDFLKLIVSVKKSPPPNNYGMKIVVGGAPAFFVKYDNQYVSFVRPNTDAVLFSHPSDVKNCKVFKKLINDLNCVCGNSDKGRFETLISGSKTVYWDGYTCAECRREILFEKEIY